MMLLTKGETPFLVMGLPVYKGYYTVHDDANNRLGFVPHVGSTKNGPYFAASFPTIDLRDAQPRTDYSNLDGHGSKANAERIEELNADIQQLQEYIFWIIIFAASVCCCICLRLTTGS